MPSRTLSMASATPTPPTCTHVSKKPPARRTPGRSFRSQKKHTFTAAPEAPTSSSATVVRNVRKRLKGIRTEIQRFKKADIAAATLSKSRSQLDPPPAKGVREPSGKGVDFDDPLFSCLSAHARPPRDRSLRGQQLHDCTRFLLRF